MKSNFIQTIKVIALAGVLAFGVQYASAQNWVGPSGSPPGNNVPAPLNVGASGQIKTGGITLGSGLSASGVALNIPNGKVVMKLPTAPTVGQVLTAQDTAGTLGWSNATGGGGGGTNNNFYNGTASSPVLITPQLQNVIASDGTGLKFGTSGSFTSISIDPAYHRLLPNCALNQIAKQTAPFVWSCANEGSGGGSISITNCSNINVTPPSTPHAVSCPAGKIMTGVVTKDYSTSNDSARIESITCCTLGIN